MKKNLILTGCLFLFLGITYLLCEWWPAHYGKKENWIFSEEELASFTTLYFGQSNWQRHERDFYLQVANVQIGQDQVGQNPFASWFKMDDILGRQMALVIGHLKIQQILPAEDVEKNLTAFFPGKDAERPPLTFSAENNTTKWQLTLGHQLNYADTFYAKLCQREIASELAPPVTPGPSSPSSLSASSSSPPCQYFVVAEEAPLDTFYAAQDAHRSAVRYERVRRVMNAAANTLLNHDLPWPAGKFRAGFVYFPFNPSLLDKPLDEHPAQDTMPAWKIWQNYGQLPGYFIQFADHPVLYELSVKQISHWQEFWQNPTPRGTTNSSNGR